MSAGHAAVFVDKDGTLVEDVPYNVDPARVVLAPGAAAGLERLAGAGFRILVVSNQAGVALGRFAQADLAAVETRLQSLLERRLSGFYWCTHHPQSGCGCRKPAPGLLLRAAREHDVDLPQSWMVGDILDDIEAGHRAGCRACLIDNGNETEWQLTAARVPDLVAGDLAQAATLILEELVSS
jgi:D-glycero-D-manno-heptose 1,7-bisphosphate phosphatase